MSIFLLKNLREQIKKSTFALAFADDGAVAPVIRCNKHDGAIAQLVEQRTENPCVPGSIPGGTTPPFISPVLLRKAGLFFVWQSIWSKVKGLRSKD